MDDKIVVTRYGVHKTSDDIYYLQQGNGRGNNFLGLSSMSPFRVQTGESDKNKACPHNIYTSAPIPDREHWNFFQELYRDELVQEFLPIPRDMQDPIPFINQLDESYLVLLSKLSSPVYNVVFSFRTLGTSKITQELKLTNVTPLVLTGIKPEDQQEMEAIAAIAKRSPRKLILAGHSKMVITKPIRRISSYLHEQDQSKLFSVPMESLGAVALRRWARGERIDSPFERKVD